ncbi:MAG TPA: peptide ABC transporter substrate-binding protein [Acidimicrobiia bacterium]
MRSLRTKRAVRWMSLLAVFALVAAACGTSDPEATTTTAGGDTTTTAAEEATTTSAAPVEGDCPDAFCVKYNIHPDAAWADGEPVIADDFAFTYETIMNDQLDITSREGYIQMSGFEVVDDKTFVAQFSVLYAPWQTMFSAILPKHEMEGKPFNSYWDEMITLGSGPFVMSERVPTERIVLQRNENYWASEDRASGAPLGDVQTVNIVFLEDSQTQVQALKGKEIDMFYPQPQVSLVEEVDGIEGVEWEAGLGPVWEHIDFNHTDPLLSQKFVRQAIVQGIDRDAIVEAVIRPIAADAVALNNSVWLNTSANYEDHMTQYPYDPVAAEAFLTDNGCTKGSDGIYECDGQRLSFNWATTAGNEGRELQFALAQANLAEIGIEVNAAFGPASEVFADEHFYGDSTVWQIFNFAWVGSPDPAGGNTLYYCEGDAPTGFGGSNNLQYCNESVDAQIKATDTEVDPAARAALYNAADAEWLEEVPLLPLYQKPTFFAWNAEIVGPKDNATQIGPFWNIAAWTGKEVVTYGADQEPDSMNVFEPDGNLFAAGLISTAVLEGAFTITPDFQYVEQLITSAEPIVPAGG